jgi:hypothetical protein
MFYILGNLIFWEILYFANLEKLVIGIFCKSWKMEIGKFWESWKTGNCRIFYILGNLIFCKSWEIGIWKILGILENWNIWNIWKFWENW